MNYSGLIFINTTTRLFFWTYLFEALSLLKEHTQFILTMVQRPLQIQVQILKQKKREFTHSWWSLQEKGLNLNKLI